MERIPRGEVRFYDSVDTGARLFVWKGNLYRGLTSARSRLCTQLFQRGIAQGLVNKGLLVETELTQLAIEGYDRVLRHRHIPFVTHPNEWCSAMLKDAALLTVDLVIELEKCGLTLSDPHPWNVLFDGPKPIYVDFGSIEAAEWVDFWAACERYYRPYFLYILELMSHGDAQQARRLLYDHGRGALTESDFVSLARATVSWHRAAGRFLPLLMRAGGRTPRVLRAALRVASALLGSRGPSFISYRLNFLRRLREEAENIRVPFDQRKTEGGYRSPRSIDEWTPKHRRVHAILSNLRPESVLVIGSSGGYSQLAALSGATVVALDVDESSVTKLYQDARERRLRILPVLIDVNAQSLAPALSAQFSSPACERFRADSVLALTSVRDLVRETRMDFQQFAEGLGQLARRWLLVEFSPCGNTDAADWQSLRFRSYTLENLIGALRTRFPTVNVVLSPPDPLVLLVCSRP